MNQIASIAPIKELSGISGLKPAQDSGDQSASLPFKSMFEEAVGNVKQTDAALNQQIYQMTTGQSDNLHDVMIASQKASLSVDLLVEMRDKVLDAYNEIMRMSV